jgi:hypothetical protein
MFRTLKSYIREVLLENFQSHTFEPEVGADVVNVNTSCKHYGSEGEVLAISELPGDAGKTIVYRVTNSGTTFRPGDELEKTLDQLAPMEV